MKLMTNEEGKLWLQSAHIESDRAGKLHFPNPKKSYLLPKDSGAKTALARLLTNWVFAQKPIVLVLKETDVWPSSKNEFLFIKYRETVSPEQIPDCRPFDDYPFPSVFRCSAACGGEPGVAPYEPG